MRGRRKNWANRGGGEEVGRKRREGLLNNPKFELHPPSLSPLTHWAHVQKKQDSLVKFEHKRIVEAKIEWQNCRLGSVTSLSEAGPTLKSLLRRSRYLFLDCNGRNGRNGSSRQVRVVHHDSWCAQCLPRDKAGLRAFTSRCSANRRRVVM